MADMFDGISGLTLNIQEATQDSDLIKVNPYLNPEIIAVHGVQTGIVMDKYIPILGQIEDIGLVDPGTCGVNTYTGNFPVSEKTWTPKTISQRIPLCVDDIPAKLKFWREQQKIIGRWENISKPLEQYVLDLAGLAVSRAIIRIAEFGDTAAALVANGGYITAGSTVGLFTMLSGMWKQIFVDGALGTPLIPRYTITENSGGDKAAQLALAADRAYEVFAFLTEAIAPEALSGSNMIQCTKTLWDNWVRYIESKSGAYMPELLQDGMSKTQFRGYPIKVRPDWDRLIKKYHDLGTTYYFPHRALITDINNMPIGTNDTESFSALDVFYDKVSKKVYIDVAWNEDLKVLQEVNMVVAY
jgi:hypothetical protein